jgi:hypothetical protein
MSKIALKRLTETVEALRKAREQLKEAEVEQ